MAAIILRLWQKYTKAPYLAQGHPEVRKGRYHTSFLFSQTFKAKLALALQGYPFLYCSLQLIESMFGKVLDFCTRILFTLCHISRTYDQILTFTITKGN